MINEYNIIQNSGIGALALHAFVTEFYKTLENRKGPIIPLLMPILPIVYNRESTERLCKNNRLVSSFYNSLSDNRLIPIGLQDRMEKMSSQTFKALNLAFSTSLLDYDKVNSQILPVRNAFVPKIVYIDNIKLLKASKLLGFWFSQLSVEEIMLSLNITF